ncbi:fibrous sheath-interacting protein 2-like [Oncorhynchus mykiss]|uniref:fibrous sheath-interacting protein 2-like n=1 Tax=Oncorhynchus mykiss TaxID=8022 RepID=UPI0018786967|nr:fibrous sheath-interacting protein 2-like [Oncorhynchus mykiss]
MRKTKPSVSSRLSAMTWLPFLPGVAFTMSRANLGKKVVCSLKEYNTYKQYLDTVKTNHDKTYSKKMKKQMLRMVQLHEEGHIPNDVLLEDMREYLLEEGARNMKHLQSTICSRVRGHKDGLQTALYDPEREFEEYWVSKERFRLKLIQNDVKHDVNKARQLKEAKEKCNRKKMCIMEQKQAIQMRKMEEELKNLQEFEKLREAAIKPNYLLEEISGKPAPVQLARLAAHTKTVTKTVSLSGKSVSPLSNHNLIMKDISEYCLLPAYWHVHSKVNAKSHPIQYCVFL